MPWNNNNNSNIFEIPWNANVLYLQQLMKRCDERDIYANERNYIQWYTSLRTIYSIIHWKYEKLIHMSKDEEKQYYIDLKQKLDDSFNDAKTHLNHMSKSKDHISKQLYALSINKLQDVLDNINFQINDFIVDSGIVNIDGDHRTWQEKISKELGV